MRTRTVIVHTNVHNPTDVRTEVVEKIDLGEKTATETLYKHVKAVYGNVNTADEIYSAEAPIPTHTHTHTHMQTQAPDCYVLKWGVNGPATLPYVDIFQWTSVRTGWVRSYDVYKLHHVGRFHLAEVPDVAPATPTSPVINDSSPSTTQVLEMKDLQIDALLLQIKVLKDRLRIVEDESSKLRSELINETMVIDEAVPNAHRPQVAKLPQSQFLPETIDQIKTFNKSTLITKQSRNEILRKQRSVRDVKKLSQDEPLSTLIDI
jgi:hypothetical protein